MASDPDKRQRRETGKEPRQVAPQSSKPPDRPWKPCVVSSEDELRGMPGVLHSADVRALHAVFNGKANADQQRRAILAIHKISSTGDMSYRPDDRGGDRDTVFAEGKRFVGLQMQKFIDHHSKFVSE